MCSAEMGGVGGPEQQYSLRWNDFHASILSSFRHLRDQEDFVDVTLACDGCSFTAHKVVLSACSPYFRTLLKANPCQHPIVILRDVREQDMEALLRFMYNGEVHIGQDQLTDFLKTAQTLQVRGLADVPTKDHPKLLPTPPPNAVAWGGNGNNEHAASDGALSPPPVKRSRSSEHTTSHSSAPGLPRFSPAPSPASSSANNNTEQERHAQPRESLLGQALDHLNHSNQMKGNSDSSLHAHSTGDESNSSDTGLSDVGRGLGSGVNGPHSMADLIHPKTEPQDYSNDHHPHNNALVLDPHRTPNFPAALLGLQGLPGLLPGPSGMHNHSQDNNFGGGYGGWLSGPDGEGEDRNALTSKPVCNECGKVYSNNSNLKQHIANVHTSTHRWEACQVCGKQFKTKQYLQVHLLATHGIRQRKSYNPFYHNESN